MNTLNTNFFKVSNTIFAYNLSPIQLAVYFYLTSCSGQKEKCWPSIKKIAAACGCSQSSVRNALKVLEPRGFVRKVSAFKTEASGKTRQVNNNYYILPLPLFWATAAPTYIEESQNPPLFFGE